MTAAQAESAVASEASSAVASGTSPDELIAKAKKYIVNSGFLGPLTEETNAMLDDEFVHRGTLAGPVNKKCYIAQLEGLSVYKAFPDLAPNPFGFCVDPDDPLRVWFWVRMTGTMTEDWVIAGQTIKATGNKMQSADATFNLIFTPEGKIKYQGVGYVADRIVNDARDASGDVALLEAFKTAGVDVPKWLFKVGPGQAAVRSAIDAACKAGGMPLMSPQTVGRDLPDWFVNLPNGKGKLKFSEGQSS